MATIAQVLTELVRAAASSAGHGDSPAPLEPCVATNDARNGDYQSNFPFRIAGALKKQGQKVNPRQIASDIAEHLPAHPAVAKAEVAGPGFLNFTLSDTWLAADLSARMADARLGANRPGHGRTMVIDYSSPNIAKRMHIGHLRSTVIGNALDRIQRYLGWTVVADNHLGDWGTQFGKLIVMWRREADLEAYEADPIGELQRLYVKFGPTAEEEPGLIDEAREQTVLLQSGNADNRALWQQFVSASMTEFERVYQRLGVSFDVVYGESHYDEALQPLIDRLLADGIAEHSDGAVVVPFTGADGKGLEKNPLLIRKSDGAALYGTTDLATVELRMLEFDPETIVYVTDHRQQLHFRQVFAAARKMGHTPEYVHVFFGMLKVDGGILSTRAGAGEAATSMNLVDLLDAARDQARAVVDEKSASLPEAERAAIAEAVGVSAIRYFDLSQNPQSDVNFTWEKALSMEGNTAPYMMYAYARCQSVLAKGADLGFEPGELVLRAPEERSLAIAAARVPEIAEVAGATWRPNMLCDHLFETAQAFSRFYAECHIVDAAQPETTRSRLQLVAATAASLKVGLGLLGVRTLDRM